MIFFYSFVLHIVLVNKWGVSALPRQEVNIGAETYSAVFRVHQAGAVMKIQVAVKAVAGHHGDEAPFEFLCEVFSAQHFSVETLSPWMTAGSGLPDMMAFEDTLHND